MKIDDLMLQVEQSLTVKAPPEKVFKGLLHRFGPGSTLPGNKPMPMILEPFAGGRWYRDRGDGIQHLWGLVQVIKPPVLLELCGPLFMSAPVLNHLEVKLAESKAGTVVTLRHRAIGLIDPEFRKSEEGWAHYLAELKKDCE
jgi:hypothetical protein